ncbi:MAG: DNA polymerase/3'-5' exonuclease PolX [Planctomycetia bacterium]|nr:DNA polymerase/3'-5' exonuclease PolX [Planctomycetia bacterium]
MDKSQVAAVLDEIGTLLELQGENSFRCNAYHNGSRAIQQYSGSLPDLVAAGQLSTIPGIGETLREKITTLVQTGKLPFYDDLKKKFPPGVLDMLRVPGMGPKKVKALYDTLHIDSLDKLKQACEAGQVAELKGFGAKTQQKILEGLAIASQSGQRVRIDQALAIAEQLMDGLKSCKGIQRIELCGSLRRRRETIKDIDILVSADDAGPIMDRFVQLPGVTNVTGHGETKSSVVVSLGIGREMVSMNADLRVVDEQQFPFALMYFTGSKEHNIRLRQRAIDRGLKLNEYELAGAKKSVPCKSEEDIYRALDMDYVPPELREDTGEIDAAEQHHLPALLEADDIQGVFHCHTTWSDGAASLEEMAEAARKLGLKYLGIGDHSQSLTVANGLTPARVKQQQHDIDALNAKLKGIHLFKGIECDILADGRLDYDDTVLASFDYVVASVHSYFNQPEPEMTQRIIRAISHPKVTMLGHATGRLLLRREGYKVDLEAVLKAAAKNGTLIEINAHPQRLDIDWVHAKRARELGVKLVINPDAHATGEIALYRFGVDVARRGWLEKKDVFNTQTLAQVTKALKR